MITKYLHYFFYKTSKITHIGCKTQSGRNFLGKICVHHQGGGNKNKYIYIDFYRRLNSFGFIIKVIKCFKRTGFLGGILYENGLFAYMLLSENIQIGNQIYAGILQQDEVNTTGLNIPLKQIRLFSLINNIEKYPYIGGQIIRAAGSYGILTAKKKNEAYIKLKSGWNLQVATDCIASIGNVSNMQHRYNIKRKAGISRSLGIRPSVRGVAMNPCDHPHGGGEGKKSPPAAQVSPWGWLTKGTPSLKTKQAKKRKKLYKIFKK